MMFVVLTESLIFYWVLFFQLQNMLAEFDGQLDRPEFPLIPACQYQNINLIFISDSASVHHDSQMLLLTKVVDLFSSGQENAENLKVGMAVSAHGQNNKSEISWLFKVGFSTNTMEIKNAILQVKGQIAPDSSSFSEDVIVFVEDLLDNLEASTFDSDSPGTVESASSLKTSFQYTRENVFGEANSDDDNMLPKSGAQPITIILILSNPSLVSHVWNDSIAVRPQTNTKLLLLPISSEHTRQRVIPCRLLVKIPCINLYVESMLNDHSVSLALCGRCFHGWFGPMPTSEKKENFSAIDYDPAFVYRSCYMLVPLFHPNNYALKAAEKCESIGTSLVSIETEAEWDFLDSYLVRECIVEENCPWNVQGVFIGLQRNAKSLGKRFRWINGRPLLYNRWFNNHPAGGYVHGCVAWDLASEKWIDLGCGRRGETLAAICEYSELLSTNVGKITLPAEPLDEITNQALTRGSVAICRGQKSQHPTLAPLTFTLKSESCGLYVNNTGTVQLVKMPMDTDLLYLCGEAERSIPYSEVCDQDNDCLNNRDENSKLCRPPGLKESVGFKCVSTDQKLPSECRCDLFKDCEDGSDEENCETCQFGLCSDGSCVPQPWLNDGETDCISMFGQLQPDFNNSINAIRDCAFLCNTSKCVPWSKLGNGVVDCIGPEGPLDETLGAFERSDCGEIPIMEWAPKCIYQKDRLGELIGCRNMHHLQGCEDFVCPEGYVKCPRAYCIPSHYLNNGEMDCLLGEDEQSRTDKPFYIPGYFMCSPMTYATFLHPDRICDGSEDCPHGLDEKGCHVTCSEGFLCVSGFVVVENYDRSQPLTDISFVDSRTRLVDFSGLNMSAVLSSFCDLELNYLLDLRLAKCSLIDLLIEKPCFPRLSKLDLSQNLLRNISMPEPYMKTIYCSATSLRFLNLSYNIFLEHFDALTLTGNFALRVLDLSHTAIPTFPDMRSVTLELTHLNLSHTRITKLGALTFPKNYKPWYLEILDLRGTDIQVVDPDTFKGLQVTQHLHSDFSKICCLQLRGSGIPAHACHAPVDPLSSCSSLVESELLTMLIWIMGVTSVMGNTGVIVTRIIAKRKTFQFSYVQLLTPLGVSDCLMGVYLLILSSKSVRFEGEYVMHDKTWRESQLCRATGALAILSSEVSTTFLFLLTIDRYMVTKLADGLFPVGPRCVLSCSIFTWVLGLILAIVPLMPWLDHWKVYSGNSVCLQLPLLREKEPGWQFTILVFIAYNGLLCLGSLFGQLVIYRTISTASTMAHTNFNSDSLSQDGNTPVTPRMLKEINLTRRLAFIAFTNIITRLLISILGLFVLTGHDLGREAFAWLTVVVFPINSALNPVLYSLPVLRTSLTRTVAKCMTSK